MASRTVHQRMEMVHLDLWHTLEGVYYGKWGNERILYTY